MKYLLWFVIAASAAAAVPLNHVKGNFSRFVEIPDDDGVMHLVDLEEQPDTALLEEISRNPNDNVYLLFTRRNRNSAQTLVMNNQNSITSSNFNGRNPTVVIAHGWRSDRNSPLNPRIRDAILNRRDANVIVLDWRRLASSAYNTAASGVPAIGRGLGQFLGFLNRVTGQNFNNMHLVGFSLGAHVVGNAGRERGGRCARVTGLDPAGPNFYSGANHLRASDGVYVEAIHTNGGNGLPYLGIGRPIANADFFPNGGKIQPGCGSMDMNCHHQRGWELFVSSINSNHLVGRRCNNMSDVENNRCNGGNLVLGNDNMGKRGSGIYRLNTRGSHPF